MGTLIIRHLMSEIFHIERMKDACVSEPVKIEPPSADLMKDLQWYLEKFLYFPFPPHDAHAEEILKGLKKWGVNAFNTLFNEGYGQYFFQESNNDKEENMLLQIQSDDGRVLSWPWEALIFSKADRPIALSYQIERRLNYSIVQPVSFNNLPSDRLNILLVIARPGKGTMQYRAIARPLMELINNEKFPVPIFVHQLRPPTFANLEKHLVERKNFYHILHFDGHGSNNQGGSLLFEDEEGSDKGDVKSANQLNVLLNSYSIPIVVMNACRSGMIQDLPDDSIASVATQILRAGMASVVAMSYSLFVTAAQKFLPAFYDRLLKTGNIAEAVFAGRKAMYAMKDRACPGGKWKLEDWMVPILYRQNSISLPRVEKIPENDEVLIKLPKDALINQYPYEFIGRDGDLLLLERHLLRRSPAIIIYGPPGIGKTTLVQGLLQWLRVTDGLREGVIWVDFLKVSDASMVFYNMVSP